MSQNHISYGLGFPFQALPQILIEHFLLEVLDEPASLLLTDGRREGELTIDLLTLHGDVGREHPDIFVGGLFNRYHAEHLVIKGRRKTLSWFVQILHR